MTPHNNNMSNPANIYPSQQLSAVDLLSYATAPPSTPLTHPYNAPPSRIVCHRLSPTDPLEEKRLEGVLPKPLSCSIAIRLIKSGKLTSLGRLTPPIATVVQPRESELEAFSSLISQGVETVLSTTIPCGPYQHPPATYTPREMLEAVPLLCVRITGGTALQTLRPIFPFYIRAAGIDSDIISDEELLALQEKIPSFDEVLSGGDNHYIDIDLSGEVGPHSNNIHQILVAKSYMVSDMLSRKFNIPCYEINANYRTNCAIFPSQGSPVLVVGTSGTLPDGRTAKLDIKATASNISSRNYILTSDCLSLDISEHLKRNGPVNVVTPRPPAEALLAHTCKLIFAEDPYKVNRGGILRIVSRVLSGHVVIDFQTEYAFWSTFCKGFSSGQEMINKINDYLVDRHPDPASQLVWHFNLLIRMLRVKGKVSRDPLFLDLKNHLSSRQLWQDLARACSPLCDPPMRSIQRMLLYSASGVSPLNAWLDLLVTLSLFSQGYAKKENCPITTTTRSYYIPLENSFQLQLGDKLFFSLPFSKVPCVASIDYLTGHISKKLSKELADSNPAFVLYTEICGDIPTLTSDHNQLNALSIEVREIINDTHRMVRAVATLLKQHNPLLVIIGLRLAPVAVILEPELDISADIRTAIQHLPPSYAVVCERLVTETQRMRVEKLVILWRQHLIDKNEQKAEDLLLHIESLTSTQETIFLVGKVLQEELAKGGEEEVIVFYRALVSLIAKGKDKGVTDFSTDTILTQTEHYLLSLALDKKKYNEAVYQTRLILQRDTEVVKLWKKEVLLRTFLSTSDKKHLQQACWEVALLYLEQIEQHRENALKSLSSLLFSMEKRGLIEASRLSGREVDCLMAIYTHAKDKGKLVVLPKSWISLLRLAGRVPHAPSQVAISPSPVHTPPPLSLETSLAFIVEKAPVQSLEIIEKALLKHLPAMKERKHQSLVEETVKSLLKQWISLRKWETAAAFCCRVLPQMPIAPKLRLALELSTLKALITKEAPDSSIHWFASNIASDKSKTRANGLADLLLDLIEKGSTRAMDITAKLGPYRSSSILMAMQNRAEEKVYTLLKSGDYNLASRWCDIAIASHLIPSTKKGPYLAALADAHLQAGDIKGCISTLLLCRKEGCDNASINKIVLNTLSFLIKPESENTSIEALSSLVLAFPVALESLSNSLINPLLRALAAQDAASCQACWCLLPKALDRLEGGERVLLTETVAFLIRSSLRLLSTNVFSQCYTTYLNKTYPSFQVLAGSSEHPYKGDYLSALAEGIASCQVSKAMSGQERSAWMQSFLLSIAVSSSADEVMVEVCGHLLYGFIAHNDLKGALTMLDVYEHRLHSPAQDNFLSLAYAKIVTVLLEGEEKARKATPPGKLLQRTVIKALDRGYDDAIDCTPLINGLKRRKDSISFLYLSALAHLVSKHPRSAFKNQLVSDLLLAMIEQPVLLVEMIELEKRTFSETFLPSITWIKKRIGSVSLTYSANPRGQSYEELEYELCYLNMLIQKVPQDAISSIEQKETFSRCHGATIMGHFLNNPICHEHPEKTLSLLQDTLVPLIIALSADPQSMLCDYLFCGFISSITTPHINNPLAVELLIAALEAFLQYRPSAGEWHIAKLVQNMGVFILFRNDPVWGPKLRFLHKKIAAVIPEDSCRHSPLSLSLLLRQDGSKLPTEISLPIPEGVIIKAVELLCTSFSCYPLQTEKKIEHLCSLISTLTKEGHIPPSPSIYKVIFRSLFTCIRNESIKTDTHRFEETSIQLENILKTVREPIAYPPIAEVVMSTCRQILSCFRLTYDKEGYSYEASVLMRRVISLLQKSLLSSSFYSYDPMARKVTRGIFVSITDILNGITLKISVPRLRNYLPASLKESLLSTHLFIPLLYDTIRQMFKQEPENGPRSGVLLMEKLTNTLIKQARDAHIRDDVDTVLVLNELFFEIQEELDEFPLKAAETFRDCMRYFREIYLDATMRYLNGLTSDESISMLKDGGLHKTNNASVIDKLNYGSFLINQIFRYDKKWDNNTIWIECHQDLILSILNKAMEATSQIVGVLTTTPMSSEELETKPFYILLSGSIRHMALVMEALGHQESSLNLIKKWIKLVSQLNTARQEPSLSVNVHTPLREMR